MLTIDRNSEQPIYLQLRGHLIRQIRSNKLRPGGRLPSIRDLSRQLGVAPLTVWNAVKALAEDGILASSGGRGTFVSENALQLLDDADDGPTNGSPAPATRKLALLLPNLGDSLAASISRGIREGLAGDDWAISVFDTHDEVSYEIDCLERLSTESMTGAIVLPSGFPDGNARIVRALLAGMPLVLVNRYLEEFPCWYTTVDNRQGGALAAGHLVERGRRRFAMVSGTFSSITVRQRLAGFLDELGRRGVPVCHRNIVDAGCPTGIADAVTQLFNQPEPPDAIFFGNDYDAMSGLRAIRATGRNVPDDVAVVGFDDHPLAHMFEPPLTTIRQDGTAQGRLAAELLLEQLALPASERVRTVSRLVPVELVIRSST